MTIRRVLRTEHKVPTSDAPRQGFPTHEETQLDLESYHRALEQAHLSALHDWGVCQGFAVAATVGAATVRIAPGVAVDSLGRHIVLAPDGLAEISDNPDQISRLVAPTADGVTLSTLGHTGTCLVTVQWRETFDRELFDDSFGQTFQTRHTPWLRLLPSTEDPGDGVRLVLATLLLDAASGVIPGGVTPSGRRRPAPATNAVVVLRSATRTAGGVVTVADSPAGRLVADTDGVLRLQTAQPGAVIQMGAEGGTAGTVQICADTVAFERSAGERPMTVDTAAGRVGIGTETPTQPLHVEGFGGLRQNANYLSGGFGWSSLSFNAFHNDDNTDWVFPDPSRPAITIEMDDNGNVPRFQVWSTPSFDTRAWQLRFAIDGNTGGVTVPGTLSVNGSGVPDQGAALSLQNDNPKASGLCVTTRGGTAFQAATKETALTAFGPSSFVGNVDVSGTLTASNKQFLIDHPVDPENRVLVHASAESSERLVVYSGNVTCDDEGQARVQLPDWLEPLATDFRYQLTCIGGHAPVYVAAEIQANAFVVAGGTAGLRVSWQVTGVRHDAWALANLFEVEMDKPESERGFYHQPEAFGQTLRSSVHWPRNQDLVEQQSGAVHAHIDAQAERETARRAEQERRAAARHQS